MRVIRIAMLCAGLALTASAAEAATKFVLEGEASEHRKFKLRFLWVRQVDILSNGGAEGSQAPRRERQEHASNGVEFPETGSISKPSFRLCAAILGSNAVISDSFSARHFSCRDGV